MTALTEVKFSSLIYRLEYLVCMHYLEVPPAVIQQLGGKLKIRLLCTVNNALTFQCGLMALGNGSAYISINKKRMKQLGVRFGDEVTVQLTEDKSKYGMDVPPELTELLEQDHEGARRFDLLPLSKRRYIIHYVASVKNSQLRIDRAILLIENLKMLLEGNESFREMLGLPKRV